MSPGVRGNCLGEAEVMALLAGTGNDETRSAQRGHLEACSSCQDVIALLGSRDESASRRIDRYDVRRELGRGAMGTVFLAHDPELDRSVALKVLRARGADVEGRMKREARSLARLSHPNVVTVFDVGVFEQQVFMTMEYVEGSSLRAWLREAQRGREEILASFLQAGDGLVAAHAARIVHRDFKPDNVLVGREGRVRVVDFGLAHGCPSTSSETNGASPPVLTATIQTEGFAGTPAYMAPEQFLGRVADARSDQFAFCISLAEALFGERPFRASSFEELRDRTTRGEVSLPQPRRDPLVHVLRRGLMPRAEDRYPTMAALLAEVRALQTRSTRLPWIATTVVVGLVVLAAAWRLRPADEAKSLATAAVVAPSASPEISAPSVAIASAPSPAPPATARPPTDPPLARRARSATKPAGTLTAEYPAVLAQPAPLGANETPLLE